MNGEWRVSHVTRWRSAAAATRHKGFPGSCAASDLPIADSTFRASKRGPHAHGPAIVVAPTTSMFAGGHV